MPKIKITLTRDSVCMGDDMSVDHKKILVIRSFIDPDIFVEEISSDYLPSVARVGHSWTCVLNGLPIAQIKSSGIYPIVSKICFSEDNHAHFIYHSESFLLSKVTI